jgi:hypothetical protein
MAIASAAAAAANDVLAAAAAAAATAAAATTEVTAVATVRARGNRGCRTHLSAAALARTSTMTHALTMHRVCVQMLHMSALVLGWQ